MPRTFSIRGSLPQRVLIFGTLVLGVASFSATAQVHGIPPSVTSFQFHVPPFLPNARPSVTSLGPYGYGYRASPFPAPYGIPKGLCPWNCNYRGHYGHNGGYWGGASYVPVYAAVPYYYEPTDDNPYLYSGPPAEYSGPPLEQTLHVVVDLPPTLRAGADEASVAQPPAAPVHEPEALPIEATVLVFRDGHHQEVTNYAIMGQTVYVFDNRKQKIGLGDIDVPATIKLNDDRGVDFHIPSQKAG